MAKAETMIRKQPPRRSKEQNEEGIEKKVSVKKEPKKRKERKKAPKNVVTRGGEEAGLQWINPAIEPIMRHNIGHPTFTFLRCNPHHSILQLPVQPNVLTKDTLLNHFKTTRPFTASLPMPLHTTPGLGPTVPDMMVRALHAKHAYQRELQSLEKKYQNLIADHPLDDRHGNDEEANVQHTVAVVYAALLDRDPDPYLKVERDYNYHFTGGAMLAIPGSASSATIVKVTGDSLQDVEVMRIRCDGEDVNVTEVQHCPTNMDGPVLEMVPGEGVIIVRKRNVIIILRELETGTDRTEWRAVEKIFSVNPFASVCFVGGSSLTLCTTDYERQLQLWTVGEDDESCEDVVQLPASSPKKHSTRAKRNWTCRREDHWSAVRCVDGHSLVACLDRTRIHLYTIVSKDSPCSDPESSNSSSSSSSSSDMSLVYRGANDFSQWVAMCEQYCALETNPSEGLLFIATSHKLIVGKIEQSTQEHVTGANEQKSNGSFECGSETLAVKVLLVFAHNLKQCPTFLSHQWDASSGSDGKEHHFVLFGSHLPMSYGVANFTREMPKEACDGQPVYATQHYPFHPPNFHDTYKQAQRQGHCLTAYEPLRKRFYACQSGAVMLSSSLLSFTNEKIPQLHIFVQTSAGDVLHQRLSYDFDRDEKLHDWRQPKEEHPRSIGERLQQWHDRLVVEAGRVPYRATNFKTLHKFRDILNCPATGSELSRVLYLPAEPKRKRKRRTVSRLDDEAVEEEQNEELEDEGVHFPSQSIASEDTNAYEPPVIRRRKKYGHKPPTPWRQTLQELQQYKDVLAHTILGVWGVGNSAEQPQATNLEQIPTKLPPLADVHERVGSWVNASTSEQQLAGDPEESAGEETIVPKVVDVKEEFVGGRMGGRVEEEEDMFSQPLTQSQFVSASQISQQTMYGSTVRPTVARPTGRKVYSKGF